jgi:thymidylate synthase (FAD)
MNVQVLRSTERPERLVCQAARGDYYEDYIGDTDYAELMATVDYDEEVAERVLEERDEMGGSLHDEHPAVLDAKTKDFIEKELARGHYGPFEHPQISFAVEGVPVFTERQLIRHRHLTFDVQSMRYADFSDAPYTTPETLTDATLNREDGYTDLDEETKAECRALYESHMDEAFFRYEKLVDAGVPKEDARGLLGLGTEVNLSVSGNARSFLHLLDMRRKADAQWSIRQMSEQMLDELFEWMPHTYNWYKENGPNKLSP